MVVSQGGGLYTKSFTADTALTGYSIYGSGLWILSNNPTLSATTVFASEGITDDLIASSRTASGSSGFTPLDHQLRMGESVYFSAEQGGIFWLWYRPADIDHVV